MAAKEWIDNADDIRTITLTMALDKAVSVTSDGHVSLLLPVGSHRMLFAGDVVFFGGKILLQNIHDCRLDAEVGSLRKLRGLSVTALLPGHLSFSLTDGQRHGWADSATLSALDNLGSQWHADVQRAKEETRRVPDPREGR